ncbi:UNVERIFIED_CONTAM: hypothetical protein Scaly_1618200 [Sesamum calycinum]|uniref:Uncharacterized protein n=1 Tax=Sesamum calycinum TaxID=2727403 RepID=A0AAW2P8B2_9LAMI
MGRQSLTKDALANPRIVSWDDLKREMRKSCSTRMRHGRVEKLCIDWVRAETAPTKAKQSGKPFKADSGCFIGGGPHRARDCPKKEKLSALIAGDEQAEPSRVNPLQLLNAIRHEKKSSVNGLMYVDVVVNG